MKKIITTVGTSLFTNYMKPEAKAKIGEDYVKIKDQFDALDTCVDALDRKADKEKEIRDEMQYWLTLENTNACAEIKSLSKIAEQEGDIEVYLLATDTVLSVLACELIRDFLGTNKTTFAGGKIKEIHFDNSLIVKGLQVKDAEKFETIGLENLIKIIDAKHVRNQTILNISGGYKAMIPVATLIGQLNKIPLYYIYEDSEDPIEIGNLPIQFDWSLGEKYYNYLLHPYSIEDKTIRRELVDLSLIRKNRLTIIGELFLDYIKQNLPLTKTTLGFFIEYKIFEYLLEKGYKCLDDSVVNYPNIIHSCKDSSICFYDGRPIELDFVLKKAENYIIAEVKSHLVLIDNGKQVDRNPFQKFKEQLNRQLTGLKVNPIEYTLYLYLDNVFGFRELNVKKVQIEELNKLVIGKFPDCKFRVFACFISHNKIDQYHENAYVDFMKYDFTNIKEYNLNN